MSSLRGHTPPSLKCVEFHLTFPFDLVLPLLQVDFKALDKLLVQPLGLYGSKSEIVTFLSSRGVFNEEM